MTDWDQRPAYPPDYGESQQGEGGVNHDNNCVPTALGRSVRAVGGPDIEPQAITDHILGPNQKGPEDIGAVADFICSQWPGNPGFSLENPNDTIAAVDAAGMAGKPIDALMHCDRNGTIVDFPTGIFHECPVVAHIGATVYLWQSENGAVVPLQEDFFRKACSGSEAGLLCVWNRAIDLAQVTQPAKGSSAGGAHLNAAIVASVATPTGEGSWDVAADGGLFPSGDAQVFTDSQGRPNLVNVPHRGTVVDFAPFVVGGVQKGYWFLCSDGGVFRFGEAPDHGSVGGIRLNLPAVKLVVRPDMTGYYIKCADGGEFPFGHAPVGRSEA